MLMLASISNHRSGRLSQVVLISPQKRDNTCQLLKLISKAAITPGIGFFKYDGHCRKDEYKVAVVPQLDQTREKGSDPK